MAFEKGNKFGRGRPRGSKNRETLLKEERRAIFDKEVSQKWEKIIDELKPEYIADQFLGKAPDKVSVDGTLAIQIAKEIAEKNDVSPSDPKSNS